MSAIAILSAALESAGVSGVVALQHARGYKCSVLNACKQPCTRAIKQAPHARTLCAEQPKTVEVHPGPYLPPPPPGPGAVLHGQVSGPQVQQPARNPKEKAKESGWERRQGVLSPWVSFVHFGPCTLGLRGLRPQHVPVRKLMTIRSSS